MKGSSFVVIMGEEFGKDREQWEVVLGKGALTVGVENIEYK